MKPITYAALDTMLRSLQFSYRLLESEPKARAYKHFESGAFIVLPMLPEQQPVLPHHLAMVRGTLENYGIEVPSDFDARTQAELTG